jgi:hypothetical protein
MKTVGLLRELRNCPHNNKSMPAQTGSGLIVCFNCGSTKRDDENEWISPWFWRSGQLRLKEREQKKAAG